MRKSVTGLMIVIAVVTFQLRAHASDIGFNFGLKAGDVPAPTHASPLVVSDESAEFVGQPAIGFYAAARTTSGLFHAANSYYLRRGNVWYAASNYNGQWVRVEYRTIPADPPRYKIDEIRHIRDEERGHNFDDNYQGDRDKPSRPEWNDWRDRDGRWVREKPREVAYNCLDRHWESDGED